MRLEFIKCESTITEDFLKKLYKEGDKFFILYEVEKQVRDLDSWYGTKTVIEKNIGTLEIHPNIVLFNHDFLSNHRYEKIIGYCPIEFNEENCTLIRI